MQVKHFTTADIKEASRLTFLTWKEEMQLPNVKLQKLLYEAMVRYYFRNQNLSFKLQDDKGMQGFLLAAKVSDAITDYDWLERALEKFTSSEKELVYKYLRYLDYNGKQIYELAQKDDILLCLFLSRKSGGGSRLLANLENTVQTMADVNLYLWADITCDYKYYLHHGYQVIKNFTNRELLTELGEQKTWIYKKKCKIFPNNF